MNEKRLNEIIARKAEIRAELTSADEKRLAELDTEITALETEETEIRSRMNLEGRLGTPEPKGVEQMSDIEKRAKELYDHGTMRIDAAETRAVILTTGGIAKPTSVGGINDPFNVVSSIIDLVTVEDLTGVGGYKEAYVKQWQTAGIGTDGTAPGTGTGLSDPVFKTVAINPVLVDVLTYVSKNLKKQTPLAYEEKVRKGALIALRKKIVELIVDGNGSTEPYGIYAAENTDSETMIQPLELGAIDDKTLRRIVFAYGGDENIGAGARLFLNKKDLIAFGDVRGTSEKKAVYEITPDGANPNIGTIKDGGLIVPYVISSDVAAHATAGATDLTMIYGAPGAYKLGLFGDYEISVSTDYKFAEGLLSVKGEVMIGGNVVIGDGFVVVKHT